MNASLFSLCTTEILDGVIAGVLVNFDHVPVVIRQSIFANIQQVVSARIGDDDLPACLRRGQFFDNFEQIHLLDSICCSKYLELLSSIVTEIERPGSCLGSELVSLRLKVCFRCFHYSPIDRSNHSSDIPHSIVDVCRLIAACRNLRRLDLKIDHYDCDKYIQNGPNRLFGPLYRIMKSLRTGTVAVHAPLEQLILRNFKTSDFRYDFLIFDSLQVLTLRSCVLHADVWLQLLKDCRWTLQSLTMDNCRIWHYHPGKHVELVALNSLYISATYWYGSDSFLLSAETLSRVQDGRVCLFGDSRQGVLERIAHCLSPKMEVAYCIRKKSDFAGLLSAHQLFGQRLVELRVSQAEEFPEAEELDQVIGALQSIRVLIMNCANYDREISRRTGDQFLRRFFSDPDRCANLRWLQIRWRLRRETVRLVFRHCYNLEFLCLVEHGYVGQWGVTDEDLTIWAANGAEPKEVYLGFRPEFTIDGVNRLLRNCGDDLKASFLDERRQFVKRNDELMENVVLFQLSW